MPNTVQLTQNGQPVYPVTDVSLITGLEERSGMRVIPYTTRPTASAETAGFIYMDESTLDLYVTKATSGSYSWVSAGNLSNIDLDNYATKTELEQLVQEVKTDGFNIGTFDHSTFISNTQNIPASISMSQVGDYVEMKANMTSVNYILFRSADSYNKRAIGHSSAGTLTIRLSPSTPIFNYTNAAVKENAIQIIKVEFASIDGTTYNYDVYLDGTKVGSMTGPASLTFDTIGHNVAMDLYYIKNKSAGVESTLTNFAEMEGAVGVTDVNVSAHYDGLVGLAERISTIEDALPEIEHASIGEDMYYAFKKVSGVYNMASHFAIYQRLKDNYYLRTIVGYYTASGDLPHGYWRMERSSLVTITDGVESLVQDQILTAGENEFVLQWLAGASYNASGGFTGGYHFGEKIEGVSGAWVEFIADGNAVSTEADIPITPCKSFYYREYSAIYNCNDDTIAAWHLKETEFKDGGYETINDVKFVQALDYFAYPGIVCVSRWLSEYAMPEGVATITDMGDGSTTIAAQFKSNGHRIHYEGNGYMCDVESEVLIGADDTQCQRVVYNSSAYNKYYRRNPDTAGSVSNRLKGRTTVKISAL